MITNFRKHKLTCHILFHYVIVHNMRIPKSPHFPFYDFSTIFYEFPNLSKIYSISEKIKSIFLNRPNQSAR
jgi:hypothetical protein